MEFDWILFAFTCGLAVKLVGMPPLVGYLGAGFILNYMGFTPDATLDTLANVGITLMLFTIGLKVKVQDLLKTEVWAGSLLHMGIWTLLVASLTVTLSLLALPFFTDLDWFTATLLGFALSFSSTVCIVKLLEEAGEMKTRHGKLAIGVLIIQDIAAVLFLVFATGKVPSPWALLLLLLIPARPLFERLLNSVGHGELLPLIGFFLAFGGYEIFSALGVKGDLGALCMGILLSAHPKATELNKSLLNFKDLFLIGFFLMIGFKAIPSLSMIITALGLTLLLPIKMLLFSAVFSGLRLRGRTAFLSGVALTNFSEFGLIVASICAERQWLSDEWLVILALSVALSFIFTSLLYLPVHNLYRKYKHVITRFESDTPLPEDVLVNPKDAEVLLIGLGRVGTGAYHALHGALGDKVWGFDAEYDRVNRLKKSGMQVFCADAEDINLWENLNTSSVKLILLALPNVTDNINITEQIMQSNYSGIIAAVARYGDDRELLLDAGIDNVFNFYTEAGTGFADESLQLIGASHHHTTK